MDSQRKNVALLITVLFIQFPYKINSQSPLVKELCEKTNNSTFCIKTLESDSRTPKAKNAADITKIFLSIGIKDANNSRDYIDGLSKMKGMNPRLKAGLEECANSYNATSMNFRSALGEVEEGEYEIANYDIMVCDDQVAFCQTALSSAKLYITEISHRLNVTLIFINIGATLTNGL